MITRMTSSRVSITIFAILAAVYLGGQLDSVFNQNGDLVADGGVPVGTDFPVFYAAGRIVADGDGDQLYSVARNRAEFAEVLNTDDYYIAFPYPAWMALPYAALARLPYLWAYAVATVVMFGVLAGAVVSLARVFPVADSGKVVLFLGLAAFSPLGYAMFAGQNTAFLLLCFASALGALQAGKQRSSGVWLGLMLFKPQVVGPLLLLLAWRRQWRTLGWTAMVGAASVVVGVFVAGLQWPRHFVAFLTRPEYREYERDCCGLYHVSVFGVADSTFYGLGSVAFFVAAVIAVAVIGLTVVSCRGATPGTAVFPLQYGLCLAATIVLSPHALFYETALLLIPILAVIGAAVTSPRGFDRISTLSSSNRLLLIALFIGGYGWVLGRALGIQPLAVFPIIVFVLCLRSLARTGLYENGIAKLARGFGLGMARRQQEERSVL